MGHWNYRLVVTAEDDSERDIDICEVYYDEDGAPKGYVSRVPGVTVPKNGCGDFSPIGELARVFIAMQLAVARPVIKQVEGRLVETAELLGPVKP